ETAPAESTPAFCRQPIDARLTPMVRPCRFHVLIETAIDFTRRTALRATSERMHPRRGVRALPSKAPAMIMSRTCQLAHPNDSGHGDAARVENNHDRTTSDHDHSRRHIPRHRSAERRVGTEGRYRRPAAH